MRKIKTLFIIIGILLPTSLLFAQTTVNSDEIVGKILTEEDIRHICELDYLDVDANTFIPHRELRNKDGGGSKRANIQADFVGGWPQEAINAFEYAMDVWESHIDSPIPIRVVANWNRDLGENTLGSAGPTLIIQLQNEDGLTYYPIALASAVSEVDYVAESQGGPNEVDYDITVNMNANFPSWYFGTDAQTPSGQWDFVTVVLHEVGHGLGFTGSVRESGGGSAQMGFGFPVAPIIYDRFVIDGNGNNLTNRSTYGNPSQSLFNAVTGSVGGIYFAGLQTIGSYDGSPVPLYDPSEWNQGSSYSHVDLNTFTGTPDALMRPQISSAFAIHSPGSVVCTIFGDMGWPLGESCAAETGTESQIVVHEFETGEINFGVTNEGKSLSNSVTISNAAGASDPLVARIAVSGESSFRTNSQTRFLVLQPGEKQEIPILFAPSSEGVTTSELVITHNSQVLENPISLILKGEALERETTFILEQNYPNPFNSTTRIPYALSEQANVRIDVYDALGRHVKTLLDEQQSPGRYNQVLQANDLSSGLFIYRIVVDGESATGKLLYTK